MILYPLNGDTGPPTATTRKEKILFGFVESIPWARHGPQKNGPSFISWAWAARASVINYLISTVFNQRSSRAPSVNIGQTSRGSYKNGRGQRLLDTSSGPVESVKVIGSVQRGASKFRSASIVFVSIKNYCNLYSI
ncbi:unnamed protein product [Lasius platythorax]|uniref:Uncharacterized protein n=1 Tax=Lasius platythorax TaxID=488582 RepID=A0AAV2NCX4_9HYME